MTGIIGPGLFTLIAAFISTRRHWQIPGAPFLLAAALLVTAAVIAFRATAPHYDSV